MKKTPKSIRRTQLTVEQVADRARRAVSGGVQLSKAERVKRAKTDFEFFCSYYLAPYFPAEPASFHREVIEMVMMHDRVAVAAPREHAKSTLVSFAFVLHQICCSDRHFVVVFRESEQVAQQNIDDIRQELEENELMREDFGDLVGDRKWAGLDFITSNKVKVLGRGRGSAARGLRYKQWRPDLVILDDIEDDELVESRERRDKLDRWLKRVVSNIVAPTGKLLVIGTILHHDSVLSRLLKRTEVYVTNVWQAWIEKGIKPLWPARWSIARLLAKEREIGARDFNTEFLNNPANEEDQIFDRNNFGRFRDEDVEGQMDLNGAIDPAIGQKAKNDDTGVGVVGERTGNYYVLKIKLKKLKFPQQVQEVISTCREFPLLKFGIETVAYQQSLKDQLEEECREHRLNLPIAAVEDISSDKIKRISTLSPLVEQKRVWFASASSSYWTPDVEKCIDQFEALGCSTDSHDDGPDVIQRAIALFRGRRARKGTVTLV